MAEDVTAGDVREYDRTMATIDRAIDKRIKEMPSGGHSRRGATLRRMHMACRGGSRPKRWRNHVRCQYRERENQ